MSLDSIIGYVIVPLVFLWLGAKIYKHEKATIDRLIDKVKGLFTRGDDASEEINVERYNINYGYGH